MLSFLFLLNALQFNILVTPDITNLVVKRLIRVPQVFLACGWSLHSPESTALWQLLSCQPLSLKVESAGLRRKRR